MKVISISNQKGGVGKTVTAHNLGYTLPGRKLLIDADAQGSLTRACGVQPEINLADVVGGAEPGKVSVTKAIVNIAENLDLLPGDIALSKTELDLVSRLGRENVIKKILLPLRYDYILIDTPPSLSLLTIAALTASDAVIIPVQPQQADLHGFVLFLDTLDKVRQELNGALDYRILITFYDKRLNHHKEMIKLLADYPQFNSRISRSIRVAEAIAEGKPLHVFDKTNQIYRLLADEVTKW